MQINPYYQAGRKPAPRGGSILELNALVGRAGKYDLQVDSDFSNMGLYATSGSFSRLNQSYRDISDRLGLSKNTVLDIVKHNRAA